MEKAYKILKIVPLLFVFLAFTPHFTSAASLSISPATATYSVGERVTIRVTVSGDVPLNATQGVVSIPTSLFSIESLSKSSSVLNFWVLEPKFSNIYGTIQFEGVATSPFQGNNKTVITINLRAIKEGTGTVSFQSGQILANDGNGTEVTSGLNKAVYTVVPAKPSVKQDLPKETEESIVADLVPPVISLGKQDGLMAIVGTTEYPRTDVLLTFLSSKGSKVFISGSTDGSGGFKLIVPQALKNGPYAVSGVVVMNDGRHSTASNIISIEVGGVFYLDISWETSTYISLFLVILLLILLIYLVTYRRYKYGKSAKALIRKELDEAEDILHKSFKTIREDSYNSVRANLLNEDSKTRESDIIKFKNDLDNAEKSIKKEIEDVDSVPFNDEKKVR